MPRYLCKIGTPSGQVLERECDASSREELRRRLGEEGLWLLSLREKRAFTLHKGRGGRSRLTSWQFLSFNQELLVLLRAGLPILQVLEALRDKMEPGPLQQALAAIRDDVRGGRRLSDAFGEYQKFFPPLYLASIRAGEQTGDLPVTLQRFLDYYKRMEAIKSRVKGALFYPVLLLLAVLALLIFMMVFVVPRFSRIYADANVDLPVATRLLVSATDSFSLVLPWLIPLLLAAVAGIRMGLRSPSGRLWWDRHRLGLPLLGILMRHYSLLNFIRTTATIIASGMPLLPALELAGGTLTNRDLESRLASVTDALRQGGKFSEACESSGLLPPMAARLVAAGESAGALQYMLNELAAYLEDDLDRRLHRLTTMIEPVVMIVIGLVIGGLVVTMYLPIFKIGGTI
jgi:type IV pilus assembly protein PilC